MPLKKMCRCGAIIDYADRCCSKCMSSNKSEKAESNRQYDNKRKDDKEYRFYHTNEWLRLRAYILNRYNHIDLYSYYINNKIIVANTIHHVVEVRDDWSKRLDVDNLFTCSIETHSLIHVLYKQDENVTKLLLKDLINRYLKEFDIA